MGNIDVNKDVKDVDATIADVLGACEGARGDVGRAEADAPETDGQDPGAGGGQQHLCRGGGRQWSGSLVR